MGLIGGLVTMPINAIVSWLFKREEQILQNKLDMAAKKQELLLQHKLELQKIVKNDELDEIKASVKRLEKLISNG